MKAGDVIPLTQEFDSISDPRSTRHDLPKLLTVDVCTLLSGVDNLADIELLARQRSTGYEAS